MCLLIESIKVEHKKFHNLELHQERVNLSFKKLFPNDKPINLFTINIPSNIDDGLHKCRITYSKSIEKIEFEKYTFKKVTSLKIVHDNKIDYSNKYLNRQELDKLRELRDNCDDILIIKNGFVTDTSYNNVIFSDGKKWYTPNTFLLKGTQRTNLLYKKMIFETVIREVDILKYKEIKLINCFNDISTGQTIPIQKIFK